MKIAITSQGDELASQIDLRFGRARYFVVFDTETGEMKAHDNTVNLNAVQGAGIQTGQNVVGLGVEAVVTGNVGPKAVRTLKAGNVNIFLCPQATVQDAIEKFKQGQLEQVDRANVEGHWI